VLTDPEMVAGSAVNILSADADACCLFKCFAWDRIPAWIDVFQRMRSLDRLLEMPRRVGVTYRDVVAGGESYAPPLPATGSELSFSMRLGPTAEVRYRAELMLRVAPGEGQEPGTPAVSLKGVPCVLRAATATESGRRLTDDAPSPAGPAGKRPGFRPRRGLDETVGWRYVFMSMRVALVRHSTKTERSGEMKKWVTLVTIALASTGAFANDAEPVWRLEPLPYAVDALEPHMDAQTMDIHYNRHHRGYYNNLVNAAEGTDLAGQPLESILSEVSQWPEAVRNNGGGHYNHSLFWTVMSPDGGGDPAGLLGEAIEEAFGSYQKFREEFERAALSRFGSGWAWLCVAADGSLFVTSTPNQDNPLMDVVEPRGVPILGLDVWEHAYYLKYQNQRGRYIDAFWRVVNWPEVESRFKDAGTF
jgi:superoxide dismutase, Fe-Mn family